MPKSRQTRRSSSPTPAPAAQPGAQPDLRPRQQRSAVTEDRLLQATIQVLDAEGYDAATVPRIAAEAKLSPAALYRRFADKDDLLRAALMRVLLASNAANLARMPPKPPQGSLAETCEMLVNSLLKQYRAHPLLLRALSRMITAAPDTPFTQEALQRIGENLAAAGGVLLQHKDSIRHPDPERAARFAVLSAASAIEAIVLEQISLWHTALPLSDKALTAELTRQMLGYLRRKP